MTTDPQRHRLLCPERAAHSRQRHQPAAVTRLETLASGGEERPLEKIGKTLDVPLPVSRPKPGELACYTIITLDQ